MSFCKLCKLRFTDAFFKDCFHTTAEGDEATEDCRRCGRDLDDDGGLSDK